MIGRRFEGPGRGPSPERPLREATMKRCIGVATVVLAGGIAVGCEGRQPLAPDVTGPLFAAATTTPITATATLMLAEPGETRTSDGIIHIRDQVQTGTVSGTGGLNGSVRVVGRSDVEMATGTGTGSGKFMITVTSGTWEGSFEGRFDAGLFSGKLVAQGTGALAGQILRGSISQTAANRIYFLKGTILTTGS